MAHYLRTLGVGPEKLVGLCMQRSPKMVVAALGIMRAGGAYLPLDPAYPSERLAFMLKDAPVVALITEDPAKQQLPSGSWTTVVLSKEAEKIRECPETPPAALHHAENLAYVIYTSGSSGRPKGVEITHASLVNLIHWHCRAFAVRPTDRASQLASIGFDAAVWEVWPHLAAGASVHFSDDGVRLLPASLRDWLLEQKITISFVPTALAEELMGLDWPTESSLRILLTGADTLHQYPSPKLPFVLVNNYGPTEGTVVATYSVVSPDERPDRRPAIGKPIDNATVYILDENLKEVPPGTVGELYIGGAGVARGYLNQPELNAEKFIPNPFNGANGDRLYRTGDLARYLPDGQIAFMGRLDDQIKLRGYRIELGESVTVLNQYDGVQASTAVMQEDQNGEKRIVAYVVPATGAPLSAGPLREFLGARLPEYMLPSAFVRVNSLPLNANGKVDRTALPAPDDHNTLHNGFTPPRTAIEDRVAKILTVLLEVPKVGSSDNFFLLGGHSLLGTQVISRIRETFGIELPLRALFDNPTVSDLSSEIERRIVQKTARIKCNPQARSEAYLTNTKRVP
jgi:amino acid adenylation domain-containing protein